MMFNFNKLKSMTTEWKRLTMIGLIKSYLANFCLPDLTAFTSAVMSSEELTGANSDRVGRIQSMYHN